MVMARATSIGDKISLFLNEGDKISQRAYLNLFKKKLVPWINLMFGESVNTPQQD